LRVIDVLNELPSHFVVKGIVPEEELKNEVELRKITGAKFELEKLSSRYIKFLPNYAPTLFGMGRKGKIYFILPGVPTEKEYLRNFLDSFYYKAFHMFSKCE